MYISNDGNQEHGEGPVITSKLDSELPIAWRIERIDRKNLEFLGTLQGEQSLLKIQLLKPEDIADTIEQVKEKRKADLNKPDRGTNQFFNSLSEAVDMIDRSEQLYFYAQKELEPILERGIELGKKVDILNQAYDLCKKLGYERTERDINNDETVRDLYEKLIKEIRILEVDYDKAVSKLRDSEKSFYESCEELERIVNVRIATMQQLADVMGDSSVTVLPGEGTEKEHNYESGQGIEEEENLTLGEKTVLLKYPVIFSCLSNINGVEVEIDGLDSADKTECLSIILNDSEYKGIKFRYNGTEYIALVANKYGDAIYFLPFSTFEENQCRLTKSILREVHAVKKNWNITDNDTQKIEEIINDNLDSIQNLSCVRDIEDNLRSKVAFIFDNEDIEKVTREIAKYFQGTIESVLKKITTSN